MNRTNHPRMGSTQINARPEMAETDAVACDETQKVYQHLAKSPLGVVEWQPDGRILSWSERAAAIFGWSAEETRDKTIADIHILADEELEQFQANLRPLLAGTESGITHQHRHFRKDGSLIFCEWFSSAIFHDEATHSVLSFVQDITETALIQESLSRAQAKYRRLFEYSQAALNEVRTMYRASASLINARSQEAAVDAVVMSALEAVKADGVTLVLMEPASSFIESALAVGVLEDKPLPSNSTDIHSSVLGRSMREHHPLILPATPTGENGESLGDSRESSGAPEASSHAGGSIAETTSIYGYACAHFHRICVPLLYQKDSLGALLAVRKIEGGPFRWKDADLLATLMNQAAIGIMNSRLHMETERQAQKLQRSNDELEQFAYVTSHDLQEPLRMISSFSQLLGRQFKDVLPGEAQEYIDYIEDGSRRMHRLIEDLLALSRVGTRGVEIEPISSELPLLEVLFDLQPTVQAEQAQITYDPMPLVMADRTQLGQVFMNLIANAIKFRSEAQPQIHISAQAEGERWILSVQDNGIGIASQFHERIFLTFQRLHTQREYPGTGIGLAICKKIIERHGGQIWVEPAPEQGSIFKFTLPAVV